MLIAQRPTLTEETITEQRSRFVVEPLEPGFGYTLGNSLRRTLLSSKRGQKGRAAGYSLKEVRARENALNEQAEQAYRQLVADWQAKAPKRESGVAAANGARLSRPSDGATAARQDSAPEPALRSGVDHAHSAA